MGIRDLLEVIRVEAINRMKEERKRRKEGLKVRLILPKKGKHLRGGLERRDGLV
ncbi:hypothetical protein [Hydrogenivirga sp. 128-5-R1-1]|uniref:hypothetical protein n=1 Tax=Hydrogenivirga sp. 128-5-R1-1 TaxID=392423 RepID=UPI00015F36FF|nr:hypothetical protein [Hydrogenivirga sp. 128-5-R1-1]EDP76365.1 hypothetical protein HG1285_02123 [Hydrogenivirga sp. 128-5-R1-1]